MVLTLNSTVRFAKKVVWIVICVSQQCHRLKAAGACRHVLNYVFFHTTRYFIAVGYKRQKQDKNNKLTSELRGCLLHQNSYPHMGLHTKAFSLKKNDFFVVVVGNLYLCYDLMNMILLHISSTEHLSATFSLLPRSFQVTLEISVFGCRSYK